MYVNEVDNQLRVAHLILRYTPISRTFQAPRCVIKDKDPRLHCISVAYEGFVVSKGIPLPKSTPFTQSLLVATLSAGVSSLSPILQEEEEGKEEQEEQDFVDVTESVDECEVFNQPSSPKSLLEKIGIQRQPQKSLLELIENQPGKGGPRKSAQPKLPPPPPKSPPYAPRLTLPSRIEQADPKRRREQKGKDAMETGRPRPTSKEEAQQAVKQQKVSHAPGQEVERIDIQPPEP